MSQIATPREAMRPPLVSAIARVLIVLDAVALLAAGIAHLTGVRVQLGASSFVEPPILPAGIVETLAGLVFVAAAYAVFARGRSAWGWALGAHLFAIAGFVLGIWATRNGTTPFNRAYHLVMLAVFVGGLVLLLLAPVRRSLARLPRR